MIRLTRFGTYGFLSVLLATQLAMVSPASGTSARDRAERSQVDAKKSARSFRRDVKKTGRKLTGQDNAWDDTKDEVRDGANNAKDEMKYQSHKLQRKTR